MFLNCTQHQLTQEQIEAIKNENPANPHSVKELKELAPGLFDELKSTPNDYEKLVELANEFHNFLCAYATTIKSDDYLLAHLPIGSPAFQHLFAQAYRWSELFEGKLYTPVFSHTERIIEEKDGKKISTFKFKKFIIMEY